MGTGIGMQPGAVWNPNNFSIDWNSLINNPTIAGTAPNTNSQPATDYSFYDSSNIPAMPLPGMDLNSSTQSDPYYDPTIKNVDYFPPDQTTVPFKEQATFPPQTYTPPTPFKEVVGPVPPPNYDAFLNNLATYNPQAAPPSFDDWRAQMNGDGDWRSLWQNTNHPRASSDPALLQLLRDNPNLSPYDVVNRYAPSATVNADGSLWGLDLLKARATSGDPYLEEYVRRKGWGHLIPETPPPNQAEAERIAQNLRPGMTGQQILSVLPQQYQPTATAAQISAANRAYADAERAYYASQIGPGGVRGAGDPALKEAMFNAKNEALRTQYGPLGHNFAMGTLGGTPGSIHGGQQGYVDADGKIVSPFPNDPTRWTLPDGTPLVGTVAPNHPTNYPKPGTYAYNNPRFLPAAKYGYTNPSDVQQTLRNAGWDPATGARPVGRTPAQQQMLDELAATQTQSPASLRNMPLRDRVSTRAGQEAYYSNLLTNGRGGGYQPGYLQSRLDALTQGERQGMAPSAPRRDENQTYTRPPRNSEDYRIRRAFDIDRGDPISSSQRNLARVLLGLG